MTGEPLSDNEVHERLCAAAAALGHEPGRTMRGDTAIEAARRAMALLQLGLVAAMDAASDQVPGVLPSTED
jgi:hypothetical protein